MSEAPAKNSTRATVPFTSLADAVSVTVAGMVNVAPFAGLVSDTEGGGFDTTMFTAVDVFVAPLLSVARAVSEYEPAATLDHVIAYGLVVSVPRRAPFAENSTFVIEPPGSLAVAVSEMFDPAVNVAPFAGFVSDTEGGEFTTMFTAVDVVVCHSLSVARAVSE
jgi:hypothetical protein